LCLSRPNTLKVERNTLIKSHSLNQKGLVATQEAGATERNTNCSFPIVREANITLISIFFGFVLMRSSSRADK